MRQCHDVGGVERDWMTVAERLKAIATPPEERPDFRILNNNLRLLVDAIQANTTTLDDFINSQTALLDTFITEVGICPVANIGTGSYTFAAQTADIELVIGLYAWFPTTAKNALLNMGSVVLPLAPGWSQLVDINLLADRPNRVVTWGNASNNDQPFVVLFTRPAPGGIPGTLHG